MTLGTFAPYATFSPGIAPQVALAIDPTELGLALAAIATLPLLALLGFALRARTSSPPRARGRGTLRAHRGVRACAAAR